MEAADLDSVHAPSHTSSADPKARSAAGEESSKDAESSSLQVDNSSDSNQQPAEYDNFYSPVNTVFYASRQYKSLRTKRKEIRLLELCRGTADDPIICKIHDNQLIRKVSRTYVALSYCAGNHRETEEITVNGVTFNVFASLGKALRKIRQNKDSFPGRLHMVWVDQICIDQSSPAERAHQVLLMRDIYRNSGRVMVWLGDDPDDHGLYFLRHHSKNVKEIVDSVNDTSDDEKTQKRDAQKDTPEAILAYATTVYAADFIDLIDNDDFAKEWQTLKGFAASPWWSRGWVCQEIIVASSGTLMFGSDAMDWGDFCKVWPVITKATQSFVQAVQDDHRLLDGPLLPMLQNCGLSQFERIKFILEAQEAWHKDKGRGIRSVLEAARSCQVTDPKDRIYAFLGLVDSGYMIEPNYLKTNSLASLFCYTAKRTILFEQSLDLLCHSQENKRALNDDLPSWVPDWSVTRDRSLLQSPSTDFNASDNHKAAVSFGKDSNGNLNRVLRAQCLVIDELANPDTLNPGDADDPGKVKDRWISLLQSNVEDLAKFVEPMAQVFWRGDGGVLASDEEVEDDRTNQTRTRNQAQKDYRKALVDESLGGNWNFFISPKGYIGLAHRNARYSDKICILLGASVPFILREEDDHYLLVGEAYVHGLMDGEAIEMMQREEVEVQNISIW
jgi:Heterokaryon incompatibility protein (HET)